MSTLKSTLNLKRQSSFAMPASLQGLMARHITLGAACALAATLYWGVWPSWSAWQSAQRQTKVVQEQVSKAQAQAAHLQQQFEPSQVALRPASDTLVRLIELSHVSPVRYGVVVSEMSPVGVGRSNTGTVAIDRLVQTDDTTGLPFLGMQIKGKYTALDGLYSFIDALGPSNAMAVQTFEASADTFVLTLHAYAQAAPR